MTLSVTPRVAIRTGESDSRSVLKTPTTGSLVFDGESVTKRTPQALNSAVCGRRGVSFLTVSHSQLSRHNVNDAKSGSCVCHRHAISAELRRVSERSNDVSANRISCAFRLA